MEPDQSQEARLAALEEQAEVDLAVIAALEAEGVIERARIADLETALATCRRIGAAIGIIMAGQKVTEARAFDILRAESQRTHRKLRDVAGDVLLTGQL